MNRLNAMGLFICFTLGMVLRILYKLANQTGSIYYGMITIMLVVSIIFYLIIIYKEKK